jgi:hypothetical protein
MAQNFPIFYMISFGIQYLYITSKISSEKESKDLTHSWQIVIKFPDGRLGTENFKINNY